MALHLPNIKPDLDVRFISSDKKCFRPEHEKAVSQLREFTVSQNVTIYQNGEEPEKLQSDHMHLISQSQKSQGFLVADFARLFDERRSHWKIFLLFNMDKRTLRSKI